MTTKSSTPPRNYTVNRRQALSALSAGALPWIYVPGKVAAQTPAAWQETLQKARGQTVYFNAWAGSEVINRYIAWAAQQMQSQHGLRVEHVKISDAADVVKRIRNEKLAGAQGSVDTLWINGENFLTMKREGMLYGPINPLLPNYALVDTQGKPTTRIDFSEPVDGMEAPWGMAQLTFMADRKRVPSPPQSTAELLEFARSHKGRLTYPRPPDFHGTTFLKQLLVDLNADRSGLYQPVTAQRFQQLAAPLWTFLDALHPHLWRGGRQFAVSAAALRQMMADGELLWALTFNPNEAANEIAAKRLPESVISYQFPSGTIGNTHFLAVPYNARSKEGALVFIDFLLSPLAQARKADITVWGDPTVLDIERLSADQKALFSGNPRPGQVQRAAPAIPEPHGSWVDLLEKEWTRRYGV